MSNKLTLPEDVWRTVAEFLPRADLCSLAQCSKSMLRLVEPVLYRSVDVPRVERWFNIDTLYLCLFARTLIEHPHLRKHVRSLNVRDGYFTGKDPIYDVDVPSHADNTWTYIAKTGYVGMRVPITRYPGFNSGIPRYLLDAPRGGSWDHERIKNDLQHRRYWADRARFHSVVEDLFEEGHVYRQEHLPLWCNPTPPEYTYVNNGDWYLAHDKLVGLILSMLPDLRYLDFEAYRAKEVVQRLFQRATNPGRVQPAPFAKLRHIRFADKDHLSGYDGSAAAQWNEKVYGNCSVHSLASLDVYFRLPALECFSVYGCGYDGKHPPLNPGYPYDYSKLTSIEPRSCRIRHLELRDCNVDVESLATMIRGCKDLKTFINDKCHYLSAALQAALRPARSSLQALWLGHCPPYLGEVANYATFRHDLNERHSLPPMDLVEFDKLQYLQISAAFLITSSVLYPVDKTTTTPVEKPPWHAHVVDRLPASLKSLHVTRTMLYSKDVFTELEHLILHTSKLPNLKEIIFEAEAPLEEHEQWIERWDNHFKQTALKNGIASTLTVTEWADQVCCQCTWTGNEYPYSITGGAEWIYKPDERNPIEGAEQRHAIVTSGRGSP
ncbi:MAG: hypothetical protein M1828_007201 [Chrysothrix sp. TS-e1954]|nr:MAG: hypothetical protein M1828_007201 [Chrysothrix sp. TS-e1954]